jgi:hypothetical protein
MLENNYNKKISKSRKDLGLCDQSPETKLNKNKSSPKYVNLNLKDNLLRNLRNSHQSKTKKENSLDKNYSKEDLIRNSMGSRSNLRINQVNQ